MFRGFAARIPGHRSMEPYLRFALSQPVSAVVIGCDTIGQLKENAAFAREFTAMTAEEQDALIRATEPFARELMYYKP